MSKEYNDIINNPGPGEYSPPEKKGPCYSIGKSKSLAHLADTPGSGRYNVETRTYKDGSGNAFGKSKRTSFASKNVAGVGDYRVTDLKGSQGKLSFSKADRFGKR